MEIMVIGRRVDVTEALKQYASNKVAKLPRYYDRVQAIEVVTDRLDSHQYHVEIIVKAEHADSFIATSSGDDLYRCIDDTVNKLERQLTDHKERLRNRKHNV